MLYLGLTTRIYRKYGLSRSLWLLPLSCLTHKILKIIATVLHTEYVDEETGANMKGLLQQMQSVHLLLPLFIIRVNIMEDSGRVQILNANLTR